MLCSTASGKIFSKSPQQKARSSLTKVGRRDQPGRGGAVFSSGATRTDPEGWQKALSRGARRRQRRAARPPRRPIPADLVGRCFNCFSPSHTAALCRERTCCFRCRSQGHRSYECPAPIIRGNRGNALPRLAPGRALVWRRVSPANEAASASPPPPPPPATVSPGGGVWWRSSACSCSGLYVATDVPGQRGYERCPLATVSSGGCG